MQEAKIKFGPSLRDLSKADWIAEVSDVVEDHGFLQNLGKKHSAAFVRNGETLLVSFETHQGIETLSPNAHPLGWDLVRNYGWSNLAVISDGDTWFRDSNVYGFFDRLVDDGFFDEFEQVLFYGAGPCGYAAAAFSVAAPGARVLAVQPQATLDPRVTEWDPRFTHMRRTDFTDRYGYAPDMLDAADSACVIYDPSQTEDAMHAALFTRPNVTKLRLRHMGATIQTDLLEMECLSDLMEMACEGALDTAAFASLVRVRRDYPPYLRRLLTRLENDEREVLIEALCRNVTARMNAPRFARRLKTLKTG